MMTSYRYNVGDVLTFKGVMVWDAYYNMPTKYWREVVVSKAGNFLSKITIYPPLIDSGKNRTVVKMPQKLRVKEHKRANNF